MPWLMGIDEAGYGPNLGPFVMSAALFHVPESAPRTCGRCCGSPSAERPTRPMAGLSLMIPSASICPDLGLGVSSVTSGPSSTSAAARLPRHLPNCGGTLFSPIGRHLLTSLM